MDLKLFASNHQVSERVKALDTEVVTADDCQLRQYRKDDTAQLEMVVDQELSVLHERLNVLTDRVRVFRPRERLDEHALTLRLLHILDFVRVAI